MILSNFLTIFDSISLNKVLQNGCKCPQNSFIELICGHTNAIFNSIGPTQLQLYQVISASTGPILVKLVSN